MSNVKENLKVVTTVLRKAQNAMFSSKFDEAYALLDELAPALEQAQGLDADNIQVKNATNQVAKLRKDLDKRTGREPAPASSSSQKLPPKPVAKEASNSQKLPPKPVAKEASNSQKLPPKPVAKEASNSQKLPPKPVAKEASNSQKLPPKPVSKDAAAPASSGAAPTDAAGTLPGGVTKRLADIDGYLGSGKVSYAQSSLEEIERMYAGQFDEHDPQIVAARERVQQAAAEQAAADEEAARAKQAAEAADARRRELNDKWRSKLSGIRPFGHQTGNAGELMTQRARFEAARGTYDELVAEESFEMDPDVESKINDLRRDVEGFEEFFAASKRRFVDACLEHVKSRSDQLDKTIEGKPSIMSDSSLAQVAELCAQYDEAFEPGGPERAELDGAIAALRDKNAANLAARSKQVNIRADAYAGDDAEGIKAFAQSLVNKRPGPPEILATVVTKDDWEETSGWEDYAGDQRFVTRRKIFAQVAARENGGVQLHSIAVTKELRSDKTWSALAGNIMWSEEMAAENLG